MKKIIKTDNSKARIYACVCVSNQVDNVTNGSQVEILITTHDHFEDGEKTPLTKGATIKIASSGIVGKVMSVNKDEPYKHTAVLKPIRVEESLKSAGTRNKILAGEVIKIMATI